MEGLLDEVELLKEENMDLRQENENMKRADDDLSKKVVDLKGRWKRNNVLFYGLEKRQGETSENCEGLLQDPTRWSSPTTSSSTGFID
ncbi:hypothetical protein ACOMHN_012560 [Nucella lapillus]